MPQSPRLRWRPINSAAILFLAGLTCFAESFDSRQAADVKANPSDLHFRLDTEQGQRSFHMGERIPITLSFSSDTPDKYKLNAASYDRSGRLPTEEFVMEKEVTDPYIDYFGGGVLGWLAGGLRTNPVLGPEPVEIHLELNQWFRFDVPGQYRLYLKSHRLKRESAPGESDRKTVNFAAVSNVVEIEILPADAAWDAMKLAEIRTVLDPPGVAPRKSNDDPQFAAPPSERTLLAGRELEYLGTAEAVQTAFDIARKTGTGIDTLLLYGACDRKKMVQAFDDYLADPSIAVQEWDIRLRASFTWLEKEKPQPLPIFSWQSPQDAGVEESQRVVAARQTRYQEILRDEAVRLIPLVEAKNPAERKASADAIAALAPAEARAAQLVPPDDYGLTREQLIAGFSGFPEDQQAALLDQKWDLIRGPEMIPALRQVLATQKPQAATKQPMPLGVWGAETGIAIVALERLAQLSPLEVVRLIRADILSGEPRFAGYAVRELPAQSMPDLDAALRVQLKKNYVATMPLVAKFGSTGLLDDVRKEAAAHPLACALNDPVLNYLVRVQPEENGDGRAMLHKAMGNRKDCGFFLSLLGSVAAVTWNPAIQAEAVASLDDPDAEVAASAAAVLAAHGGPEVEEAMWRRLEKWSEEWRGRTAELEGNPITATVPKPEARLGTGLFYALARAQSWLMDEPRRKRLLGLCVETLCREEWGRPGTEGPIPIEVANGGGMYPSRFSVADYNSATWGLLKGKLLQFPARTQFCWSDAALGDAFSPGQRREMLEELTLFLRAHSMTIQICSQ